LDNPTAIRKGGKNGDILQEGSAEDSPLYQRIRLALSSKEHMPPRGQTQLSRREVETLKLWIDHGADMSGKLISPAEKEALIAIWQSSDVIPSAPLLPKAQVKAAPLEVMEALQERGITVVPITANSGYLSVNLLEKKDLSAADWELLVSLKNQLIWLKAGGIVFDETASSALAQLQNLRQLDLSQNELKDADLVALSSLKVLQSLNLSFNQLGVEGLKSLLETSALQRLYLFGNQIPSSDQIKIQEGFPETEIEFGDYSNLLQSVSGDSLEQGQ